MFPLGVSEIFTKLHKPKFKIKYTDQNDANKQIDLEHEISNLEHTNFGVKGYVKYRYQKENEFKGDGIFDVTHEEFTFLFVPEHNFVILHGNPLFRTRLMKFFAYVLHNGDDIFESILISKGEMYKIMNRILLFKSGENNLEAAQFFHHDKSLENLKKLSFTTDPHFCGTDHDLFQKHYDNCTHWDFKVRVYRCNGLLDESSTKGYLLKMTRYGTASFTLDKTMTEWNRFVVETVKPILRF